MKKFSRFLGGRRRASTSGSVVQTVGNIDEEDDISSRGDSAIISRGSRRRSQVFKSKRKETQDILAEPDQFLEKLLENGLFGPDMAAFMGSSPKRDAGTIYKEGKLEKQGNFFKTWHKRYFVLTSRGLSYYESKGKFQKAFLPLGVILFKDVVTEGNQVVHDVSDHLVTVLQLAGKRNLFCVHIENRTYVMSAASREEKLEWARAITKAYHRAMDKTMAAVKQVKKSGRKPEFFSTVTNKSDLATHFEVAVTKLQNDYHMRRTFLAWNTYYLYSKTKQLNTKKAKPAPRKPRQPSVVLLS